MEENGAGELFINSIDLDGTYLGYDNVLIKNISELVDIPIIACGGASKITDFYEVMQYGASAVAAGSLFVYQGAQKGILINYPTQEKLAEEVYKKL